MVIFVFIGDVTNKVRIFDITFQSSVDHLLKVAYKKDGEWFYPFANDYRWIHWAQNTIERHRFTEQNSVYLEKKPEYSNISEQDLLDIVNNGGEESKKLLSSMRAYSGNILGSNSYFLKRRTELEALMVQEGLCSVWFTFSAADNHWRDLFELIHDGELPTFEDNASFNRWKRRIVKLHPHLVDVFFNNRVDTLLKHFFAESTFDCAWYWYRVEFQERGTAHVHGCFKLKDDPGLSVLGMKVARGRCAAHILRVGNKISIDDDFESFRRADDEWGVCKGMNNFEEEGMDIDEASSYDLENDEVKNR